MPTGYTAAVADGTCTDLNDFIWGCARAMGALVTMRDDPNDATIPDRFEPSTNYHDNAIDAANLTLEIFTRASEDRVNQMFLEARDAAKVQHEANNSNSEKVRIRYEAMLTQVQSLPWPDELASFRDFMTEQLQTSISHDCVYQPPFIFASDAETWKAGQIARANSDIKYHKKARLEEIDRVEKRNSWINLLRETLK